MESEFVRWLRTRLPRGERIGLGPGDDAAILRLGTSQEAVVSTDLLVDSVHFRHGTDHPRRIGRKALAVNLSDLAAMAAVPVGAVISLAIPKSHGLTLAQELYEGLIPLSEQFDLPIAGGDTNSWNGPLAISVTIIGEPTERGVLLRSGAHPGDQLLVTGSFGGSRLGKQFDFIPRVNEALQLNRDFDLRAGLDCSDGLALDSHRLATESGLGLLLDLDQIPIAAAAEQVAADDASTPLEHALGDGEDFELVLAVAPEEAARLLAEQPLHVPLACIGEFIADNGLYQRTPGGMRPLLPTGFLH